MCLLNDLFLGDRPALAFIAVENACIRLTLKHCGKLLAEIESVVDAAIHAHTARRAVEMCRVSGEEYAALSIGRCEAAMNAIGARFQHFDVTGVRHDVVQQFLLRFVLQRLFRALSVSRVKAYTPDAGQSQQTEGTIGFPAIGNVGEAFQLVVERIVRGRKDRRFRVDIARHFNIEQAPDHTARTVRANDVVGGECVFALRCRCGHAHAIGGLLHLRDRRRKQYGHVRKLSHSFQNKLAIFRLFALQTVGMFADVLQC